MEAAPYQDYYCNSHNVNTPVSVNVNTFLQILGLIFFWGKKSCREVRREKNIPQSIEKVKNIPHSRFLGKKFLLNKKQPARFLRGNSRRISGRHFSPSENLFFGGREASTGHTSAVRSRLPPPQKLNGRPLRDGPLEKLWGGEGNFRAAGIFFRYQIPCMNFFQALAWIFLRVNWRARHWREQLWCGCSDLTHLFERRGTTYTLFFFI